MKNYTRHLAPFPRRFPLLPQIETIGYLPRKENCMKHSFRECNFSFILSGSGSYVLRGKRYTVTAPCVLLQWPGEPMDYGPPEGETWEELYLIYPGKYLPVLRKSNTFSPEDFPVRPFTRTARFENALEKVKTFTVSRNMRETDGDTGDLLCWDLVTSSFAPSGERFAEDRKLERIRRCLESNAAKDIHLEELAAELKMSVSTLRRYWMRFYGETTFGEYRDDIFLRKSCRMLVETRYAIKEIASHLGFDDIYYFSRKFRRLSGMTASAYREKHKVSDFI